MNPESASVLFHVAWQAACWPQGGCGQTADASAELVQVTQQAVVTTPAVNCKRFFWDPVDRRPGTIFGSGPLEAPAQEHVAAAGVLFASCPSVPLNRTKPSAGELTQSLPEPVSSLGRQQSCAQRQSLVIDAHCNHMLL